MLQMEEITLVLLKQSHTEQLVKLAVNEKIWEYAPELFYKPEVFKNKWLDKAINQMDENKRACFVVLCSDQITGTSSYYDIDMDNKTLNIGYTWFHPDYWGTKINAISKLILIDYAFNSLKFNRVGFCVDSINQRSCNALKKLGIKQEGVLRNHLILSNGRVRNSAVFSVISEEWPEIRKIIMKNIEILCK
jgi:RimJ/RimL family protein N-acetyltransferase